MQDFSAARPIHGGNLVWAAGLVGCSPSLILDFSASINPLGPPASAIAAIHEQIGNLRNYPDPSYRSLRAALGQFHQISPDWVLPGNGAAELLTWSSRELAELDITYLTTPAFHDYRRSLKAFSANIAELKIDFGEAREEIRSQKSEVRSQKSEFVSSFIPPPSSLLLPPSCGILLNNPHNPTGLMFAREALLPYLERFTLVVVDEAFMDFLTPEQQQSVIEWVPDYPNLVVLRSLTKFYSLPGLRIGYAIAHSDRLRRWREWRDPWSVNALAAAAAEAVVQDVDFQKRTWNWLAQARSQLFDGLSALPGLTPYSGVANFLLVKCEQSVAQLQRRLLEHSQILIRDCISFKELGDCYFRVAVRTQAENQRLLDGLAAVLENSE